MGHFVLDVVGLQLLLHFALHIAAAAAAGYAGSFKPQETQNFWPSEGLNYTFGFKGVGAGDYLLSIWHSRDANQTAIWWADFGQNHTSTVKEGAIFNYNASSAPILRLYDATSFLVWQCCGNYSSGSGTSLQLLDTGNLRLSRDNSTSVLWESFQDPRDSLMLVGLEESVLGNNPYLLRSRKSKTSYAHGRFHMATYNGAHYSQLFGVDALSNQYLYMNTILLSISDGELVGLHASGAAYVSESPKLERLSLGYDANLRVYRWFSNDSAWKQVWQLLNYSMDGWLQCRAQSPCGPFGICSVDGAGAIECSCPVGYEPISADDPSKGCNSTRMPRGCGEIIDNNTTTMVQQQGTVYYFYNDLEYFSNISDIDNCKSLCLSDCACVAATYAGSKCYLKGNTTIGYLVNGMSTPTGKNTLFMKLLDLPAGTGAKKSRRMLSLIAVTAAAGAITLAVGVGFLIWRARSGLRWSSANPNDESFDVGLVRFHYHELIVATNSFSHLLGEGGFGKVYKGWLEPEKLRMLLPKRPAAHDEGSIVVAIKVLKQGAAKSGEDSQEKKQFEAEVGTLSKIHHVNLVGLLGYCISGHPGKRRLLVYEYMEKGSLDRYLHPAHMQEPLPWPIRFSIAVGTARGIAYLHHDCKPRILHCDIKPQNVLLDDDFTPKVADFGVAERCHQRDQSHVSMSGMRGTRGYMAPEWLKSKGITSKVDVYSFGILLLELVHGLNTTGNDHMSLIEWASQCLAAESLLSDNYIEPAADDGPPDVIVAMEGHTTAMQSHSTQVDDSEGNNRMQQQLHMLRVALWCVQHLPVRRPSMSRVLQLIEGGGDIDNPPNPADATIPSNNLSSIHDFIAPDSNQKISYSVVSPR